MKMEQRLCRPDGVFILDILSLIRNTTTPLFPVLPISLSVVFSFISRPSSSNTRFAQTPARCAEQQNHQAPPPPPANASNGIMLITNKKAQARNGPCGCSGPSRDIQETESSCLLKVFVTHAMQSQVSSSKSFAVAMPEREKSDRRFLVERKRERCRAKVSCLLLVYGVQRSFIKERRNF